MNNNSYNSRIIYQWNSGKIFTIIFLIILLCCIAWIIFNSSLLLLLYVIPFFFLLSYKFVRIEIREDKILKHYDFKIFNRKIIIPLSNIKKFETGWDRYSNYVYRIIYFKNKRNGKFSLKDEDNFQIIIKNQDDFDRVLSFFKSKNVKVDAKYPWYNDRMYNDQPPKKD